MQTQCFHYALEPSCVAMLRNINHLNSVLRHRTCSVIPCRFTSVEAKPEGWDDAKPYESIPGFRPLPLIGNTWRYFFGDLANRDFLKLQKNMHRKFGDIIAYRKQAPIPDMVHVYNPKDIELLIRNEGIYPIRDGMISQSYYRNVVRKDIFGNSGGLLTTQGKDWHEVRSKVNPILLQPRIAKNYIKPMDEVSSDFIRNMKRFAQKDPNGELQDFLLELNKFAFESIGVIALDRRFGVLDEIPNPEAQQMISYMVELFKMMAVLDFTPIGHVYRLLNFPYWKKFVKYNDYFTNMTLKFLDEAEERIRNLKEYQEMSEHEKSAFEKLLKVDKKIAMIMTLDMLGAGIDTTGKATGAALYFLAKNPAKQEALRKEVMAAMPTPDTPVTKEVLEAVPYVRAVIKETGRLAPIGAMHSRRAAKNMVLGGYRIPKGTTLLVPTLYLSTNEENYIRPMEFIPERWLKSADADLSHKSVSPFITLPFGFGPRSCVGRRFANLEMEIVLTKIVRNFTLQWTHKDMTFAQHLLYGIDDPLNIRVKQIEN